ncbi:MAG: class I SAM-dependent methyltransferase [Candidatus Aminicenantes bacterium]|nr:class I SAM-dependent methyltransferase [Candidatus Aminicenantes bacterium]
MKRVPEPELMEGREQARAYAHADFEEPHSRFLRLLQDTSPIREVGPWVVDLGCGSADISIRVAKAYPDCRVHGVDASRAMLDYGRQAIREAGLEDRVQLHSGYLPGVTLPRSNYDTIVSNSLLHHLPDPMILWREIHRLSRPGSGIFVMDLLRPDSRRQARELVRDYCGDEPEILQRDFYHSLLAAYRPDEIFDQLREADLEHLEVRIVSDRHMVVAGRVP